MIIDAVTVRAFKSFTKEQTFDLTYGEFILVGGDNQIDEFIGANGAGKSTLFDAICWCFYGLTAAGLRASSIKSWHSTEVPRVAVEVELSGVLYTIARTQSPNSLTICEEDAEPVTVTQAELDKKLGINHEEFLHCVLMGQFNRFFFDRSPTDQLNILTSILKLDFWVDAASHAKKDASEATTELNAWENSKSKHLGSIEANKRSLLAAEERAAAFEEELEKKISGATYFTDELVKELGKAEEKQTELNKQAHKARGLTDIIEEEVADKIKVHTELCTQKNDMTIAYRVKSKEVKRLEDEMIKAGDMAGSECQTCHQLVSGEFVQEHVVKLEAQVDKLLTELEAQDKEREAKQKEIQRAHELMVAAVDDRDKQDAQKTKLDRELAVVSNNVVTTRRDLLRAREDLTALEQAENPNTQEVERLSKAIGKAKTDAVNAQKEIDELRIEIDGLQYWAKEFKSLRLWVITEALHQLQVEVTNSLAQLGLEGWSVEFDIERQTTTNKVSKGFTVMVRSPNAPEGVPWNAWSGGEAQRLRIAGAIGLANLIRDRRGIDASLEIWDEPTAHLSEQGITDLVTFFADRARTTERQIYLIDHRALDAGGFDRQITIRKTKHGSQIIE